MKLMIEVELEVSEYLERDIENGAARRNRATYPATLVILPQEITVGGQPFVLQTGAATVTGMRLLAIDEGAAPKLATDQQERLRTPEGDPRWARCRCCGHEFFPFHEQGSGCKFHFGVGETCRCAGWAGRGAYVTDTEIEKRAEEAVRR